MPPPPKKPEVAITVSEKEICRLFDVKKVNTVRWCGAAGNRKITIYAQR